MSAMLYVLVGNIWEWTANASAEFSIVRDKRNGEVRLGFRNYGKVAIHLIIV